MKELQIRQKFEKCKKREIAILEPRNHFHSLTRTSRSLRPRKRDTIADALPRNPTFRLNFRPRGQFGAKIKILSITMRDHFFWAGIISQHQIKLFRVFLKRYGAIFHPRNGCFGLKMPILGSHIIHILHSVSLQIFLDIGPYPKCEERALESCVLEL